MEERDRGEEADDEGEEHDQGGHTLPSGNVKVAMGMVMIRGERIIQYSNIIRIIFEYQNIRIRIRSIFSNRIIFVFVFG